MLINAFRLAPKPRNDTSRTRLTTTGRHDRTPPADGAKTSYRDAGAGGESTAGPARRRPLTTPKGPPDAATSTGRICRLRRDGTRRKPHGRTTPGSGGQRPATEYLREDIKTQGSPGRCARSTLFAQSHGGVASTHGTTDPRGQSPGTAARRSSDPPQEAASRVDGTRGGSPGETAGGSEAPTRRTHPRGRDNTAKGCSKSHGRRRGGERKSPRPGRENSPGAGPERVLRKNTSHE
jgi:hypothetical protein